MNTASKYMTTAEAGAELGVSASRIRQLIMSGDLPSKMRGRDRQIERKHVEKAKKRAKVGRPKVSAKSKTPTPG